MKLKGSVLHCSCIAFLLLLTLLKPYTAAAQQPDTATTHEEPKKYILIVPYEPQMYSCVGDHFICRSSNVTPGQINDIVRRSLVSTLADNISLYYNVKMLDDDNLGSPTSDISLLYRTTDYFKYRKKVKGYFKNFPSFNLMQILGPRRMRWGTDCVNSNSDKPNKVRRMYSELVVQNDSIYSQILDKYEATYCLFITRFEMNTRFKSCVDLQENILQRDLYVHFTLTDAKGAIIDGGVVGTTWQSPSNQINYILDKNLEELSKMILEILRIRI